jgi:hypothetical protein
MDIFSHPRTVQFAVDTYMRYIALGGGTNYAISRHRKLICRVFFSTGTISMLPDGKNAINKLLTAVIDRACRSSPSRSAQSALWDIETLLSQGAISMTRPGTIYYGLNETFYRASQRKGPVVRKIDALFLRAGYTVYRNFAASSTRIQPWIDHENRVSPVCRERAAVAAALEEVMPPELVRICCMYVTVHPDERRVFFE